MPSVSGVEQDIDAEAVLGGDRENFVAEFVKLRGEFGLARNVDFVYDDDGRLAGAAHEQRELLIERRGADAAVDDLHDACGVFDGDVGLAVEFRRGCRPFLRG